MKKKSILGRIGIVAAALTLATTSMMSGTLARYQTSANVSASAIIAKWAPKVTGGTSTGKDGVYQTSDTQVTIKLAETMKSSSVTLVDLAKIGNSSQDRIAPGTKGSAQFTVDLKGAEVPTFVDFLIKEPTSGTYVFPDHLKITITGADPKITATMQPQYNSGEQDYDAPDLETGVKVNTDPIRFPSVREDATQTKQSMVFTLDWEWPLDLSNNTYAQSSGEKADADAYNSRDYEEGKLASTTSPFAFDLQISMRQAANDETKYYDVATSSTVDNS